MGIVVDLPLHIEPGRRAWLTRFVNSRECVGDLEYENIYNNIWQITVEFVHKDDVAEFIKKYWGERCWKDFAKSRCLGHK